MEIISGIAGVIVGALVAWLLLRQSYASKVAEFREKSMGLEKDLASFNDRLKWLSAEKEKVEASYAEERKLSVVAREELARKETSLEGAMDKLRTQKTEMEEIQKRLITEFENISNKLLKINSQEFTQLNLANIGNILNPLKEKIEKFEKKVEETYEKGYKDQGDLKLELKKLYELNNRISEEANNLTRALKTDTKKMGNWGELILERILELSGLVKGQEYYTQYSDKNDEGIPIRPDVVVLLPDKKHIIIDSKVSLVAYNHYVNSEDDAERERFLKLHLDSVRAHIKGLSEKDYQTAAGLDTPDFVLLFMPLEPAFHLALQNDQELFYFAWQKKIVIVSPTTLLATMKTVESIWKHEKQTRNAMEIASQGKSMLEKLYNFLADMEKLGNQIETLKGTYDQAHKRLKSGKGNLVNQAIKLTKLGVKTDKTLAGSFQPELEETEDEEERDDEQKEDNT
jgi:DNA recombination protein RmuC